MKKIGLFGGTFNPVHFGHLEVAKNVLEKTSLDEILFLPSGNPPHKTAKNLLSFEKRICLLSIVLSNKKNQQVSDLDFHAQNEPSYTKSLIQKIKKIYPKEDLYFIIGEDNVSDLKNWYEFEWLLENVKFLVVTRKINEDNKNLSYFDKLDFVKMNPVNISSSEIREKIINKESLENYVPKEIIKDLEGWRKNFL